MMEQMVAVPRPSLKHRKINRDDISEPRNFRHIGHIGYGQTFSTVPEVQPQKQLSPVGDHSNEVHMPVGYEKGATQEIGFEIHLNEMNSSAPKVRLIRKASRKAAKDPEYVSKPACFQHLAHIEDTHSNEKNFVAPKAVGDQTIRNMFYVVDRNIAARSLRNSTSDQSAFVSRSSPNMETHREAMLQPDPAKQIAQSDLSHVSEALRRAPGNKMTSLLENSNYFAQSSHKQVNSEAVVKSRKTEQNVGQNSGVDDAYCLPRSNVRKLRNSQYEQTEKQTGSHAKENNIAKQGNVRLKKVDILQEDRVPLPARRKLDATLSIDSQDVPSPVTPFVSTFHSLPEEASQKAAYEIIVEIKGEQPMPAAARRHKSPSSTEDDVPVLETATPQWKKSAMNSYIDNRNHSRTLPAAHKETIEQQVIHPTAMNNTKGLGASEGSRVNELGAMVMNPRWTPGDDKRIKYKFNECKFLPAEKTQQSQISVSGSSSLKTAPLHPINSASGELRLAIDELDNILDEHVSSSTRSSTQTSLNMIPSSEQRSSVGKPSDATEKLSVKELTKMLNANKTATMGIYGREFKRAKTLGEHVIESERQQDVEDVKTSDEKTSSTISKVQHIGVNMFMPYEERTVAEIIAQNKMRKAPPHPIPDTRKSTARKVETENKMFSERMETSGTALRQSKHESDKGEGQPEQDVVSKVLNASNDLSTSTVPLNNPKQALMPPSNAINQFNGGNESLITSAEQQSIAVQQKDSLPSNATKEMKETSTRIKVPQPDNVKLSVGKENAGEIAALKATECNLKVQISHPKLSESTEERGNDDLKSHGSGTTNRRPRLSHINPTFSKSYEILHADNETLPLDLLTHQQAKLDSLKHSSNEKQLTSNNGEISAITHRGDDISKEKSAKTDRSMKNNEKQADIDPNQLCNERRNGKINDGKMTMNISTQVSSKNGQHTGDIRSPVVQRQSSKDRVSSELRESQQKELARTIQHIASVNTNAGKIDKHGSKDSGDSGNKLDEKREQQQSGNAILSSAYPSKQSVMQNASRMANKSLDRAKTCEDFVLKNSKPGTNEVNTDSSMKLRDVAEKKKVQGVIVAAANENYETKSPTKSITDESQKRSIAEESRRISVNVGKIKVGKTISTQDAQKLDTNSTSKSKKTTEEQTKVGLANTRVTVARTMSTPIYQSADEKDANDGEATVQLMKQRHSIAVNSHFEGAKLAKQKQVLSCSFEMNDAKGQIDPESSQVMETSSNTSICSNFTTTIEIGEEAKDKHLKAKEDNKLMAKGVKVAISAANNKVQDEEVQASSIAINNKRTATNRAMMPTSSTSPQTVHKAGNEAEQPGMDVSKPIPRERLRIPYSVHKLPCEDVKAAENPEKRERPIPAPRKTVTQTLTQPENSSEISRAKSMDLKVTKLMPETLVANKREIDEFNELPAETISDKLSELDDLTLVSSRARKLINVAREEIRDEWVLRL
uniref:CRIB domain-containing protein n=1 Tax=Parascaris univalens TaxID=6257 RepID=A0A915B811_PARUN